jgi:hypothetical protein
MRFTLAVLLACTLQSGIAVPPSTRCRSVVIAVSPWNGNLRGVWTARVYPSNRACFAALDPSGLTTVGSRTYYAVHTCIGER